MFENLSDKLQRSFKNLRGEGTITDENISEARVLEDLPKNAQQYIRALEDISGAPISAIGVGPGRDQTVQLRSML